MVEWPHEHSPAWICTWFETPAVLPVPLQFTLPASALSFQFSSVAKLCLTLWLHGLHHARPPVRHQLPEFTQTHVGYIGDAIQPSHPLSFPSAFNLSQHQGHFQWVSSSHQVAKALSNFTFFLNICSFSVFLPFVFNSLFIPLLNLPSLYCLV